MNVYFKELFRYIKDGKDNEVAFLCFPDDDGFVYPIEINRLEKDGNKITAISRNGSYQITENDRVEKNTRYDNILQVYDKKGEEVLTITLLDKS